MKKILLILLLLPSIVFAEGTIRPNNSVSVLGNVSSVPTTSGGDLLTVDASTTTLVCTTQEHHEIHDGDHYFVDGYADLSINQVMDFTWQMPDTTEETHWIWQLSVESETLYQVYEIAVATNPLANAVTPINNNRNSANTSNTTVKYEVQTNLAGANADTDISGATLIATGIIGAGKSGGKDSRNREIVMKRNT